jgi:hypothetical protein
MRPYMLSPRDRGTENAFRIVALAKKELIVAQIPQAQRNTPLHPCTPWLAVPSGPLTPQPSVLEAGQIPRTAWNPRPAIITATDYRQPSRVSEEPKRIVHGKMVLPVQLLFDAGTRLRKLTSVLGLHSLC